jgi:hypothetical protein
MIFKYEHRLETILFEHSEKEIGIVNLQSGSVVPAIATTYFILTTVATDALILVSKVTI